MRPDVTPLFVAARIRTGTSILRDPVVPNLREVCGSVGLTIKYNSILSL